MNTSLKLSSWNTLSVITRNVSQHNGWKLQLVVQEAVGLVGWLMHRVDFNQGNRSWTQLNVGRCGLLYINWAVRRWHSNSFIVRRRKCYRRMGLGYDSCADLELGICTDDTSSTVSAGNGTHQHLLVTVAPCRNKNNDSNAEKSHH